MYTPYQFYAPHYVKKEDVGNFVANKRKIMGIIVLSLLVVVVSLIYTVFPRLLAMYESIDVAVPRITELVPSIGISLAAVGAVFGIYLLTTPPNMESIEPVLAKYKDGELINSKEFSNIRAELLIMAFLGIVVGALIITIIVPVYNITSSL